MTDIDKNEIVTDERELLIQRATELGLKFSPNIGTDTLRERVNEKLAGPKVEESASKPSFLELRAKATKLIRVRITNLNPNKKHSEGEWFRAGNDVIPHVARFVPFEIETHVEEILLTTIRNRKYTHITQRTKREVAQAGEMAPPPKRLRNEFSIEVLPPLTDTELKALAAQQQRRAAVDLKV